MEPIIKYGFADPFRKGPAGYHIQPSPDSLILYLFDENRYQYCRKVMTPLGDNVPERYKVTVDYLNVFWGKTNIPEVKRKK